MTAKVHKSNCKICTKGMDRKQVVLRYEVIYIPLGPDCEISTDEMKLHHDRCKRCKPYSKRRLGQKVILTIVLPFENHVLIG